MKVFDAAGTAPLIPYVELAEALRAMLHDKRAGTAYAPARLIVPLANDGTLLVMPAADEALAITKLVTVHRGNPTFGLPSVQAEVVVMDARTGRRLCQLDGATVTAHRTAALSLLAAQMLAPRARGPLLIIGGGVQGRAHLEAFAAGLPVRQVIIASRTQLRAEALAQRAVELGLEAMVVGHADEGVPDAGWIVTATTSTTPVFTASVRPNTFVAAVGAYNHHMAELPPNLVREAAANGRLFVDSLDGAQAEAGDLIQADIDWSRVRPLEAMVTGNRDDSDIIQSNLGDRSTGPVVFKSVGHALWDLAAARLAVQHSEAGLG